jgi:sugar phosphate permease
MATVLGLRRDTRVVGLVGTAHGLSHVYYMALPPLFPLLHDELGLSYTALGFLVTVFNVTSGLGQTPVGFLVDRIGSRAVLSAGLILQAAAIGAIGLFPSYGWMLACVFLAGLAHTVYHPADYSILSATVPKERLGRAYSIHSFAGNVGSAISPVIMVAVATRFDWHASFYAIGVVGLAVAFALVSQGALLGNSHAVKPEKKVGWRSDLAVLLSRPILLAFLFYVIVVSGTNGIRTFAVSALVEIQHLPLEAANTALTGFMLCTAFGMLLGGVIADRFGPRIGTAIVSLVTSALLYVVVAEVAMSFVAIVVTLGAAGMIRGALQATRDLLIYSVTPEGQVGKVFAFVASGSNFGGAITPLLFGWIMDVGDPRLVFWVSAALTLLGLVTFTGMKRAALR